MQVDELVIRDPEAAGALRAVGFLGQFLKPASPSVVARRLEMPANLAHHHARKYLRLGLLFESGREKGRVLYQLTARTYKVPRDLADVVDYAKSIQTIASRYLNAYERSSALQAQQNSDWTVCHFGDADRPAPQPDVRYPTDEARPAYLFSRTLALAPEQYRRFLAGIETLFQEVEAQTERPAAPCTLTFFAFEGSVQDGVTDSSTVSSFLNLGAAPVASA